MCARACVCMSTFPSLYRCNGVHMFAKNSALLAECPEIADWLHFSVWCSQASRLTIACCCWWLILFHIMQVKNRHLHLDYHWVDWENLLKTLFEPAIIGVSRRFSMGFPMVFSSMRWSFASCQGKLILDTFGARVGSMWAGTSLWAIRTCRTCGVMAMVTNG